jgi:hypothetical protein
MRHRRAVDGVRHIEIMVQVENEIGRIPEARDQAQAVRGGLIFAVAPDELIIARTGTWSRSRR